MMKKIFLPFFVVLVLVQAALGQCPPPGTPTSTNTCNEAQFNCLNLDGYCGTLNNSNQPQQPFPGCPVNVWNNNEWIAFYAGSSSISIQITPSNCEPSNNQGLQGAIYEACGPPWFALDLQCPCSTQPFTLNSTDFEIGQIYYMVIDGCGGNVCDYSVSITQGSTEGQPPANPGPVTGPTSVIMNTTTTYELAPVLGASSYQWTMSPSLGSFSSTTNTVDVNWTMAGTANLCVTTSNECFSNPTPSCITVNVGSLPPPPNDDCGNAIPIACGQTLSGTNENATNDSQWASNCTGITYPGVWYSFVGNGGDATVSTCNGASFDTKISVYEGVCNALSCVVGNDNFCGQQSEVMFTTTNGSTYYVLVHGAGGATGTFNLSLTCTGSLPPDGAATVSCPDLATTPIPPVYVSPNCVPDGPISPSGPVVVNDPNPLNCEGTITYTWTYTDCLGTSLDWSFVYTIEREPFGGVPPNGSATVSCPLLATMPQPPVVLDDCGDAITPTGPTIEDVPTPLVCEGTRTYTWTYTDCLGNSEDWSFVYNIEQQPFVLPANGSATVSCLSQATVPVPPMVQNACGEALMPVGPVITNDPDPIPCNGVRTFSWTYSDCEGNSLTWSFTYIIEQQLFSLPPNGSATVSCPNLAVLPTPPTIMNACGEILMPVGPVITSDPDPINCEGTRTYAWTYTDCAGNNQTWSFVYTIDRAPFNVPPIVYEIVDCPEDTEVIPVPPTVLSSCGETLAPVLINVSHYNDCEGDRVYTFRFTDCSGNYEDWAFYYTVEYLDFNVPPSETVTVECPLNASEPQPPVVYDNCNRLLVPTGPVITSTDPGTGCESSRQYAWTYEDCEGTMHTWSKTFLFEYTGNFFPPTDEVFEVSCVLYAQPPIPQTLYDNCAREITITGPTITEYVAPSGCSGTRTYTYIYTDCAGNSYPWSFTYFANDDEPPVGICPGSTLTGMDINVTDLKCIDDIPCPDSFDFSLKIAELVEAGNFYDICSGDDISVELDSWTNVWQCSDLDGDSIYTFGRTFYFRIADACGNEFPYLCGITYSGQCLPLETYTDDDWGVVDDAPGTTVFPIMTDLEVIQTLLDSMGAIRIGGINRSLTVTDSQCIVDLLPGIGEPKTLENCHQINCVGCNPKGPQGMKNSLAANTIALILNMRYNVVYNDLTMIDIRHQILDCVEIDPLIRFCTEGTENCVLRIKESNGTTHEFPHNIGGLLDLANLYLNGALVMTNIQSLQYANVLNEAMENVHAYWYAGISPTSCNAGAGMAAIAQANDNIMYPIKNSIEKKLDLSLIPNPASSEVSIRLSGMAESGEVTLELHNQFGQRFLRKDFGRIQNLNERVDLNEIPQGIYVVILSVGQEQLFKKLVVLNK